MSVRARRLGQSRDRGSALSPPRAGHLDRRRSRRRVRGIDVARARPRPSTPLALRSRAAGDARNIVTEAPVDRWLTALSARYTREFDRPQLLKAIRALSARYVQRRSELSERSAVDSAGKRAAFAAFFAPLHFLTARLIVPALRASRAPLEP